MAKLVFSAIFSFSVNVLIIENNVQISSLVTDDFNSVEESETNNNLHGKRGRSLQIFPIATVKNLATSSLSFFFSAMLKKRWRSSGRIKDLSSGECEIIIINFK